MANYEMRGVCHICKMTDVEEHMISLRNRLFNKLVGQVMLLNRSDQT